jgi:rubrerythrin
MPLPAFRDESHIGQGEYMDFWVGLKHLEDLELELESLYDWFSRLHETDPSVAALFRSLSIEERAHANIIRYQQKVFLKNRSLFKEVEIDVGIVNDIMKRSKETRSREATPGTEEALEIAYEIENSIAEHYYILAGRQSNPELKKLLDTMASGCNEHHRRLAEFFRSVGLQVKSDEDFDRG